MQELLLSVSSLLIGIVATIIVSRFYFKKSLKKSLTPYLIFSSKLLSGIDPDVKKDLNITYQKSKVDEITKNHYKIKNTGDNVIQNIIHPLKLSLMNKNGMILDAFIENKKDIYDLSLKINKGKNEVILNFPFLNNGDSFDFKLLIKGSVRPKDVIFSITSVGLPPVLKVVNIVNENTHQKNNKYIINIIINLFFLLISSAIFIFSLSIPISNFVHSPTIDSNMTPVDIILLYKHFFENMTLNQKIDLFVIILEFSFKIILVCSSIFLIIFSFVKYPFLELNNGKS